LILVALSVQSLCENVDPLSISLHTQEADDGQYQLFGLLEDADDDN
jgi:hypothetical protein